MTVPTFILPAVKNNVTTAELVGAIGAGDVSIALKTGHGALFPTIYRGDCSSTGSGILLNDTGALGSLAVGDFIHNLTDGSSAVVTSIAGAPNSVATTALDGGSDNTWQSGDIWVVNMFIATIVQYDTDGVTVLKRERVKVTNLVTDTLTVVRGYDGDTAQTFLADDSVQILIEKSQVENLQKAIRNLTQRMYAEETTQAANYVTVKNDSVTWLGTINGTNTLTGTATPAPTSYAAGQRYAFIIANNNSGAVTLNVNSLGAKNLYGPTGAALSSGDILAGGIVEARYDGTQFVMTSPKHAAATGKYTPLGTVTAASSAVGSSSTADNAMSPTWTGSSTIGANALGVGSRVIIRVSGEFRLDAGDLEIRVKIGGTTLVMVVTDTTSSSALRPYEIDVEMVCQSTGASGSLIGGGRGIFSLLSTKHAGAATSTAGYAAPTAITKDTTGTLAVTVSAEFSSSNANHSCKITAGSISIVAVP